MLQIFCIFLMTISALMNYLKMWRSKLIWNNIKSNFRVRCCSIWFFLLFPSSSNFTFLLSLWEDWNMLEIGHFLLHIIIIGFAMKFLGFFTFSVPWFGKLDFWHKNNWKGIVLLIDILLHFTKLSRLKT